MRRWFLYVFAGLSLLLFLLAGTFWFRSHYIGDRLSWRRAPSEMDIISCDGILMIGWGTLESSRYPPPNGWHGTFWPFRGHAASVSAPGIWEKTYAGFAYDFNMQSTPALTIDMREIKAPWWSLMLLATLVLGRTALSVRRDLRRRKRLKRGLCPQCGYDLRATKDRCPECGLALTPAASIASPAPNTSA